MAPFASVITVRLDDNRYFYPASTVKLPLALLVLEKLQELEAWEGINRHSRYRVGTETDVRSIADDLIKLLVVSDDAAYNACSSCLARMKSTGDCKPGG